MKKLLIFIPTYNRLESLILCLNRIKDEIIGFEENVIVYVSDNHSSDDTIDYLNNLNHPSFKWSSNPTNIGMPLNILKAFDHSDSADFTWILGDDDYLLKSSIALLLNYLNINPEIDFYFLNTLTFSENNKDSVINVLNSTNWINIPDGYSIKSKVPQDFKCTLSQLLNPKIDEVMGGSLMCYVFRSKLVKNHLASVLQPSDPWGIYTSYPHTLNWIYSFNPKTP